MAGKAKGQRAEALALIKECREAAARMRNLVDDLGAQADRLLDQTTETHSVLAGASAQGEARDFNRERTLDELARILLLRRLPDEVIEAVAVLLRSSKPSD